MGRNASKLHWESERDNSFFASMDVHVSDCLDTHQFEHWSERRLNRNPRPFPHDGRHTVLANLSAPVVVDGGIVSESFSACTQVKTQIFAQCRVCGFAQDERHNIVHLFDLRQAVLSILHFFLFERIFFWVFCRYSQHFQANGCFHWSRWFGCQTVKRACFRRLHVLVSSPCVDDEHSFVIVSGTVRGRVSLEAPDPSSDRLSRVHNFHRMFEEIRPGDCDAGHAFGAIHRTRRRGEDLFGEFNTLQRHWNVTMSFGGSMKKKHAQCVLHNWRATKEKWDLQLQTIEPLVFNQTQTNALIDLHEANIAFLSPKHTFRCAPIPFEVAAREIFSIFLFSLVAANCNNGRPYENWFCNNNEFHSPPKIQWRHRKEISQFSMLCVFFMIALHNEGMQKRLFSSKWIGRNAHRSLTHHSLDTSCSSLPWQKCSSDWPNLAITFSRLVLQLPLSSSFSAETFLCSRNAEKNSCEWVLHGKWNKKFALLIVTIVEKLTSDSACALMETTHKLLNVAVAFSLSQTNHELCEGAWHTTTQELRGEWVQNSLWRCVDPNAWHGACLHVQWSPFGTCEHTRVQQHEQLRHQFAISLSRSFALIFVELKENKKIQLLTMFKHDHAALLQPETVGKRKITRDQLHSFAESRWK